MSDSTTDSTTPLPPLVSLTLVERFTGSLWNRYILLETTRQDVGNGIASTSGTFVSALILFLLLCLFGETLAQLPHDDDLYFSFRFLFFITILIAAGMFFTSRYTAGRGNLWYGGKHGDTLAFFRCGICGAITSTLILLTHSRDIPALIYGGGGGGATTFIFGFALGLCFPYLTHAIPALGGSFRVGSDVMIPTSGVAAGSDTSFIENTRNQSEGQRLDANRAPWGTRSKIALLALGVCAHIDWIHHHHYYHETTAMTTNIISSSSSALIFALGPAITTGLIGFLTRKNFYIHLHHWALGLFFLPIASFRSDTMSLATSGFCLATFAEGAARWSTAPLWHARRILNHHQT